ncbi:MAG: transketolase [Acidimicrobiia bacterium]
MLTPETVVELEQRALAVRRHIVRMAGRGGCFIGASLSCADLLVYLYSQWLSIDPARIDDPDRDVLLLSKGHDVPALYGTLAELGFFDARRLDLHLDIDDHIYWHPNIAVPGVEFHSGSLGHLPAVGLGVALARGLDGSDARTVVVVGDGELNEGSVWETLLVAAGLGVKGLTVVMDRNGFQANLPTEDLIPLEPLEDKFRAFGWAVCRVDGHDFRALDGAFSTITAEPTVVVADTLRGKGVTSLEGRADRWFVKLSPTEVDDVLAELDSGEAARLSSPTMVVR